MRRVGPPAAAAVLAGLLLALAACGRHSPADGGVSTASNPTATGGAHGTAGKPAGQKPAAAPAAETSTITRINEDGSESVEDTSADSGTHNALLAAVASTANAATLSAPSPWQEGVNYTRLVPAQPTAVAAGQVEVLEFFWYACPHCYALDPLVENWKKTKPPYITFTRVPVMWSEGHRQLARFSYTLDALGKLGDLHSTIFKEIHVGGNPLVDVGGDEARSEQIEEAFAVKHGVAADAFRTNYKSFSVESALRRADELTQRYRVAGVPTFVIAGKYVADVATAGGEERLISLVSDLAALEHKR